MIVGCGGKSSIISTTPPADPTPSALSQVAGNWDLALFVPVSFDPIYDFLGSLSVDGSKVSGVFRLNDPNPAIPCISATEDIAFSGSMDQNNLLTLESARFGGNVATFKIQFPLSTAANNLNNATGTAIVTGGGCAEPTSSVLAEFIPSITGTYIGSMGPEPGQAITGAQGPATLVLTQAAANADGEYPVTGTLTFSSTLCSVSTPLTGMLQGPTFILNGSNNAVFEGLAGGVSPTVWTAGSASLYVPPGTPGCASGFYGGPLTLTP